MNANEPGFLIGVLTHAGTITVGDDIGLCGVFVRMQEDHLRHLPRLPMHQDVIVVPKSVVQDYTVSAKDYKKLRDALLRLRSACKHKLPLNCYALLDEECHEVDSILGDI